MQGQPIRCQAGISGALESSAQCEHEIVPVLTVVLEQAHHAAREKCRTLEIRA